MQVFAGHTDAITAISFTPDGELYSLLRRPPAAQLIHPLSSSGKRLLTASSDSTLILWDPRSPSPSLTFTPTDGRFALEDGITSLAVHPNSTLAVVGGGAGGVRVVNLLKGNVVTGLQGHNQGDSVESVVFLEIAGNGVVVSAGTDGKACVWDVTTLRLRATLTHNVRLFSLRLSYNI